MKKNNKRKKKNKKGFTLVELLAVIIILAIVVGITIPAVLTTTSSAKKKAFQTAANTMADWIDRQYQIYTTGLDSTGVATLDPVFESECLNVSQSKRCDNDNSGVVMISNAFVTAAGLKAENVRTREDVDDSFVGHFMSGSTENFHNKAPNISTGTFLPKTNDTSKFFFQEVYTMVYIDKNTGRSCVKLIAKSNGDYPKIGVACGGICKNSAPESEASYCRPRNMD